MITLLAPARHRTGVLVVGDPDQAIYGWRGAVAPAMFDRFRSDYRPAVYWLTTNFRSRAPIVFAADALMKEAGRTRPSVAQRPGQAAPIWCGVPDPESEATLIASEIERAMAQGKMASYGAFAVLYRTHVVGDAIEAAMLHAGIPLWRVQRQRFLAEPDAQDSLRFLELAAGLHGQAHEPSLNWPRAIIDEVSLVALKRVGKVHGIGLFDVARQIESLGAEVSPLTREAIKEFQSTLGEELRPLISLPMPRLVDPFLQRLKARRSPIAADERPHLRDSLDLLETTIRDEALILCGIAGAAARHRGARRYCRCSGRTHHH